MSKGGMRLEWNGDRARAEIRAAALAAVTAGVLVAEGQIKALTPVDLGALRDSVTHDVEASGSQIVGRVGSSLDYAIYQEFGTGAYAENGGGRRTPWVYVDADGRGVRTSGNRPRRMFRNGFKRSRSRVIQVMQTRMGAVGK